MHNDFADSTTLSALLTQIRLVVDDQVNLFLEQFGREQVLDNDSSLMFGAFTAHLFRAPVEKPTVDI